MAHAAAWHDGTARDGSSTHRDENERLMDQRILARAQSWGELLLPWRGEPQRASIQRKPNTPEVHAGAGGAQVASHSSALSVGRSTGEPIHPLLGLPHEVLHLNILPRLDLFDLARLMRVSRPMRLVAAQEFAGRWLLAVARGDKLPPTNKEWLLSVLTEVATLFVPREVLTAVLPSVENAPRVVPNALAAVKVEEVPLPRYASTADSGRALLVVAGRFPLMVGGLLADSLSRPGAPVHDRGVLLTVVELAHVVTLLETLLLRARFMAGCEMVPAALLREALEGPVPAANATLRHFKLTAEEAYECHFGDMSVPDDVRTMVMHSLEVTADHLAVDGFMRRPHHLRSTEQLALEQRLATAEGRQYLSLQLAPPPEHGAGGDLTLRSELPRRHG